ncbi:MAG: hypothetical protein IPM29_22620 [Planctomycetes bacterium]|nr:hypothetical protein [Planctomycetota bacterium]
MTARPMLGLGLALTCGLASCSSVSTTRDERPWPATIAVLPLRGDADPRLLELCRSLLVTRMQQRGLAVVETDHTDRLLAEHGWLADPERFAPGEVAVDAVCAALGVDAVLVGSDLDDRSFNFVLLRRHAFGGTLALRRADGSRALAIDGSASHTGGLLLKSGQVLTELRAQGEHGTPREGAALVDQFVDEVVAVIGAPADPAPRAVATDPAPREVEVTTERRADGAMRVAARGTVPPGTRVWLELPNGAGAVPAQERDGAFAVSHDLPADGLPRQVGLRARDGLGRTAAREVAR